MVETNKGAWLYTAKQNREKTHILSEICSRWGWNLPTLRVFRFSLKMGRFRPSILSGFHPKNRRNQPFLRVDFTPNFCVVFTNILCENRSKCWCIPPFQLAVKFTHSLGVDSTHKKKGKIRPTIKGRNPPSNVSKTYRASHAVRTRMDCI